MLPEKNQLFKDALIKISVPLAMSTNLQKPKFQDFNKTQKYHSLTDVGAKIGLRNTQTRKRRDSESSTDLDRQNQSNNMKSERGALVRGSDPPSGHSPHETAGDTWRAPAKRIIQTHVGAAVSKTGDKKKSIPLQLQKKTFSQVWATGNFSPPRSQIHLIVSRPQSTFPGLARHEPGWPWVDSMSRSRAYRRVS